MRLILYRGGLLILFTVALLAAWALGPVDYRLDSVKFDRGLQIEVSSKTLATGDQAVREAFGKALSAGAALLFGLLLITPPLWRPTFLRAAGRWLALVLALAGVQASAAAWAWMSTGVGVESFLAREGSRLDDLLGYAGRHSALMSVNAVGLLLAGCVGLVALGRTRGAGVPSQGRVERVMDGDTFKLADGESVRLRWVDAPEKSQGELGERARERLRALVEGRTVHLIYADNKTREKYGRLFAEAYVRRWLLWKKYVQQDLVSRGLAFYNPESSVRRDPRLDHAEEWARALRRGVHGRRIERPEAYRKRKRKEAE